MPGGCEHCDHDHAGGGVAHAHDRGNDGHAFLPPPQPRRIIPEFAMLWRGLGLLALAFGAFAGAVAAARHSPWLAVPGVPVMSLAGLLAGWAAAIHLTGGEQFDDHPFV
jgi:hypothetical protein